MSYFTSDDVHLYVTAAEGFRVGQINFGATPTNGIPVSFEPDSLWNYEVGMKSIWQEGRLKLNVAAFYIDWTDIQLRRSVLQEGNSLVFTANAGDAVSKGVEVESIYLPTDHLELGTSFTYNKATLESVLDGVALTPGSTLPGTPEFSMSNYIQYATDELPNNLAGYLRLTHLHVGEMVSDIENADNLYSDTYNAFNLRAGIMIDNYEVALYADNLLNNDAVTSRYKLDADARTTFRAFRLRPRTLGLTFRIDF